MSRSGGRGRARATLVTVLANLLFPLLLLGWIGSGGGRAVRVRRTSLGRRAVVERSDASRAVRALLALALVVPLGLALVGVRTIHEAIEVRTADRFEATVIEAHPSSDGRVRATARLDAPPPGAPDHVEGVQQGVQRGDRVTVFRDDGGELVFDERHGYGWLGALLLVLGTMLLPAPLLVVMGRRLALRANPQRRRDRVGGGRN